MERRNTHLVPIQTQQRFEPIMNLVLDAVDSPHTRRASYLINGASEEI